jgi:hypothetical protein
MMMMFMI